MAEVMSNFKVLGSRILLTIPPAPEPSVIELTEEVKERVQQEYLAKLKSLEVFAVGDEVTKIKAGDNVFVPAQILVHADKVIIDDSVKLMIGERDISIIWK